MELRLISKTKTGRSQTLLKQFYCSAPFPLVRGVASNQLIFVEQNRIGLSLFVYGSILFFFLCSVLSYLLKHKTEHYRVLFSNVD